MIRRPFFLAVLILFSTQVFPFDLKEGDLILQPLECWSCYLISGETNSEYSHMALVVLGEKRRPKILEAYGDFVKTLSLNEFFQRRTKKGVPYKVLRLKKGANLFMDEWRSYLGKPYDPYFSWSDQSYYCSELIYKLYAKKPFELRPMSFDRYEDHWRRYFSPYAIPHGELGVSPADFEKSEHYEHFFIQYSSPMKSKLIQFVETI